MTAQVKVSSPRGRADDSLASFLTLAWMPAVPSLSPGAGSQAPSASRYRSDDFVLGFLIAPGAPVCSDGLPGDNGQFLLRPHLLEHESEVARRNGHRKAVLDQQAVDLAKVVVWHPGKQ